MTLETVKKLRKHISLSLKGAPGQSLSLIVENKVLGEDDKLDSNQLVPNYSSHSLNNNVHSPMSVQRRSDAESIRAKKCKRRSLPVNMSTLPQTFFDKCQLNEQNNSRKLRRVSMSEMGFGKHASYCQLEKLGEGTYATVYKGRSLLTNTFVALKEIRLEHEEGAPCTAIREVSLLRNLKHANIVTLHDIIHTGDSLTLVFEYLNRDLKQYMDGCRNLMNVENAKLFLFQLIRGLAYCHERKVLHRDLKPQNILINEKGELKLADFGLARAKSVPTKTYSHEVVTLWYRPPDVLLGSTSYDAAIDMWGVGCIFFEMVAGRPLFPGNAPNEQLLLIFSRLGTPTEATWPTITSEEKFLELDLPFHFATNLSELVPRLDPQGLYLLKHLLKYDAKQRARAADALHYDFFTSLGPDVHFLSDTDSIFTVNGIQLGRDPGSKSFFSGPTKNRRQSLLL